MASVFQDEATTSEQFLQWVLAPKPQIVCVFQRVMMISGAQDHFYRDMGCFRKRLFKQ